MKRSTLLRCLPLLMLVLASCSSDPKVQAQRYVDNGNKFFAKAKYKEAGIMYRKAIAQESALRRVVLPHGPDRPEAGRPGRSRSECSAAPWSCSPITVDAAVQLSSIYLFAATQNEQQAPQLLEEASGLAEKILAKDPNSYDGLRLSGQIALLKKRQQNCP